MRMTSRPRASTRIAEPTASIASIDSVLVSSHGRAAFGPGRQSRTPQAHDATGLGEPASSTRHMRQLPAIDSRSWKQKRGISAPAASHACSSVYSGGTSISLPSTTSLVTVCLFRLGQRIAHAGEIRVARIVINPPLDLGPEMAQQPLHRPGRAIAEGADGVALDLGRDVEQQSDLASGGAAVGHARE